MSLPTAAAIVAQAESLTLTVDLLANDLEYYAEVSALTPEISTGALLLFTKARQMLDDFARALPRIKPSRGQPYGGPAGRFHKIATKVLANGKPRT
jgi:hypothetical protein